MYRSHFRWACVPGSRLYLDRMYTVQIFYNSISWLRTYSYKYVALQNHKFIIICIEPSLFFVCWWKKVVVTKILLVNVCTLLACCCCFLHAVFLPVLASKCNSSDSQEEWWRRCAGLSLQLGSRDDAGNNYQSSMRHGRFWRRSGDFLCRLTPNGMDCACSREPEQKRRWGGDVNAVEDLNFGSGRIRGQQYPWSQDSAWLYDSKAEYWYDIFIFLSRLLK